MTITTTAATEAATQFPSSFRDCERIIVQELADVLDHMDETQIDALVNLIANARKVFFVGVGRVELALEAIAKRLAHLGVDTVMVGQITEPAICGQDLLIVGIRVPAKPDSRCSSPARPSPSAPRWRASASSRTAR